MTRNTLPAFFDRVNTGTQGRNEVIRQLKSNEEQKETLNKLICDATDAVNGLRKDKKFY